MGCPTNKIVRKKRPCVRRGRGVPTAGVGLRGLRRRVGVHGILLVVVVGSISNIIAGIVLIYTGAFRLGIA